MSFLPPYRMLDMAWLGPGPFCAQILGDLGFDVIKITEVTPGRGRRGGRSVMPRMMFHEPTPHARRLGTRNARSIALNLKTLEGQEVFHRLVRTADVIQEGFRPGVADRLDVGYQAVRQIKPDIVYVSITGYGQDGPYRDRVGHDLNYLSVAGFIDMNGRAGGPPAIPGTVVADFAAGGMSAALHILAALLRRERTGEGTYADVSMTDAAFAINSLPIQGYLDSGLEPRRGETFTSGFWPWYDVYETRDGKFVSVAAVEPWFYEQLCRSLGCEEFADKQWSLEHRETIRAEFARIFKSKTRQEWVEELGQADVCFAPVLSVAEAVQDPQMLARGMVSQVEHPIYGAVAVVGSMLRFSGFQFRVRNWNLEPGEHTEQLLTELGYTAAEIAELREREIVR